MQGAFFRISQDIRVLWGVVHMKLLRELVRNWQQQQLTEPNTTVVVACSGGIDSLALLDMLVQVRKELGIELVSAHYEHGIRGEASREDAQFVADYCQGQGIPFFLAAGDVPAIAKERKESLETAARFCRYEFLRQVASKYPQGVIATAHHKDDQGETVLMHLLRGTGIAGLAGILPASQGIIRPLLNFSKKQLAQYCELQHLAPRHDSTNDEADCTRNRLRLQLLPLLAKEYNGNIVEGLCNLAEIAAGEEAYWQDTLGEIWQGLEKRLTPISCTCSCSELTSYPLAVQRRLLQKIVGNLVNQQLGFSHLESIRRLIQKPQTGQKIQLPDGLLAKVAYGQLTLEKNTISFSENNGTIIEKSNNENFTLELSGVTVLSDGTEFLTTVKDYLPQQPWPSSQNTIWCDYDKCHQPLYWRHRQPGDVVQVGQGHQKLKKFLIDNKIPQEERDQLWLLCQGNNIIWIPGLRRFSEALIDRETQKILYITLKKKGDIKDDK